MSAYRDTCEQCMARKAEDEATAAIGPRPWHTRARYRSMLGFAIAISFTFAVAAAIDTWPIWIGHGAVCATGVVLIGLIGFMGWIAGVGFLTEKDDPWPPTAKN